VSMHRRLQVSSSDGGAGVSNKLVAASSKVGRWRSLSSKLAVAM
jgi:hypothetical protein